MAKKVKHKAERWAWLEARLKAEDSGVDILDSAFVDDYAAFTGAALKYTLWGANHCPLLSTDLSTMWKCGILNRGRIGLGGNWQPGFPTWVFSYTLRKVPEPSALDRINLNRAINQE